MNKTGRAIALTIILALCFAGIATVFWKEELRYQLPTPVPVNYVTVRVGSPVLLPEHLTKDRAYFFHFYNPDCPCSRFNAKHLRSLIDAHSDSVDIVIIVPSEIAGRQARNEFGGNVSILNDNGSLAASVGVYSTPQAAIVDKSQRLYFRGNYNLSRYCTQRATNFAELSLIALLNNNPPPPFELASTQSYGCSLNEAGDVSFF